MALNPSGQISIGGPTTGQSINLELGLSATANSSLNQANFRTLAGISSGAISLSNFYGKSNGTQRGIFAFGENSAGARTSITNLVSNTGVIATDVTSTATTRSANAASPYGGDKGVFGYGLRPTPATYVNTLNYLSNTGVIAGDTAGVGTARAFLIGVGYSTDKGLFGFGIRPTPTTLVNTLNYISNTGVVSGDTAGTPAQTGQIRAAAKYGGDKAIVGFGRVGTNPGTLTSITNLISNTGVMGSDVTGVGTARYSVAASSFGGDKAIFAFGLTNAPGTISTSNSNLVSNTGVVASDTTNVSLLARNQVAGTTYGGDKGIFAYGYRAPSFLSNSNLISNTGVIGTDVTGVGTARTAPSACNYSYS